MKDKHLDLAWEFKKTVEHEGDGDTNCNWVFFGGGLYSYQRLVLGQEDLKIRGRVETIKSTALLRLA